MAEWARRREKREGRRKNERSSEGGGGGRGCTPRPPGDAVRHRSGSTTHSKDCRAFPKRGVLGRLTPSRSYNVDEGPNLCGYHMDGWENGPKFSIPKVTSSRLNAAALMKAALERVE